MSPIEARSDSYIWLVRPACPVLSPYVWACLEGVVQSKSLGNIVEFAIIGWTWCLCLAVRYAALSAMGRRRFERFYGPATLFHVFSAAALLAAFFPTLPE